MTGFDLVFAVVGLLLGLAIAEVLGGFGRALKLRRGSRAVRIGWLTPLLGLFVMLDLTSFWMLVYDARSQLTANLATLIGVLAVVGTYFLAASLIFPDDPEEWPDFDAHYARQKKPVILGMVAANIGHQIGLAIVEAVTPTPAAEMPSDGALILDGVVGLSVLVLLVVLWRARSVGLSAAVLVVLNALLLASAVIGLFV